MDIWSKEKRSKVMARILGHDTKPEMKVRRILYGLGYRYRTHAKDLPGKPDIVFRRLKKAIFVHGCFWHLHSGCRDGTLPKSRKTYWHKKLIGNKQRDARNLRKLRSHNWESILIWECQVERRPHMVINRLTNFLGTNV